MKKLEDLAWQAITACVVAGGSFFTAMSVTSFRDSAIVAGGAFFTSLAAQMGIQPYVTNLRAGRGQAGQPPAE